MIVVADTSPLNYLVILGAIDVLPQLFVEVHAPPWVMQELQHPRAPEPVKQWAKSPPDWLKINAPSAATPLTARLDPGEAQAISLAVEMGIAAVLIDEKKGRRVAKSHGLTTLGTITVLELAAQQELLDLKAALNSLEQTTFQITKVYIDAALELDAARKRK